jgi:hypothetical protein
MMEAPISYVEPLNCTVCVRPPTSPTSKLRVRIHYSHFGGFQGRPEDLERKIACKMPAHMSMAARCPRSSLRNQAPALPPTPAPIIAIWGVGALCEATTGTARHQAEQTRSHGCRVRALSGIWGISASL